MALKDLFVPKWKHSSVEVRLSALDAVCNDLQILMEITETDSSPQVRMAAIKKIEDEPFLERITKSEKDEQVLEAAKKQREILLKKIITTSRDQQAAVAALEKFDNEKVTASYLCDNSCDVSVQRRLIKQIKSPQLLSKLTEHECAFEVAEQIVEQIAEKEYLQRIARKASNKKIRTIAQEKIDALFTDPGIREREITTILKQCCSGMDIQVVPHNYDQAVALLDVSKNVWNKYDPERCHPLAETYAAAEQLLVDRMKHADDQKNILAILEQLCGQAEQKINEPEDTLRAELDLLQTQWEAVDRTIIMDMVTVSLDDRFKAACDKMRLAIKTSEMALDQVRLWQESLEQACEELERFVGSSAAPDDRLWHRLLAAWDTHCSKHAPDESLKKRVADAKVTYREKENAEIALEHNRQQDEINRVERLVAEMELLAQTELQYMGSRYQKVVRLKQEWDTLHPSCRARKAELHGRFKTACDNFMSSFHEYRVQNSWGEWAGENAQKKLLEEIEQFKSRIDQGESLRKIARKVTVFDSQWRQAARGKSGISEMDERYSGIREHLFSLAQTRKNELYEQLKTVLAASDDGNQTETVKAIQKEWNDIGYLPQELEKDLPDLFYGLCNAFFAQRKEQYQKYSEELDKNSAIREVICAEADKLAQSSEWKSTKDAFTRLQQQWEESWPAPHKRSQELWVQFSRSRELFFERYHAFQNENDKVKEDLCLQAEQLLSQLGDGEPEVQGAQDNPESSTSAPATDLEGVAVDGAASVGNAACSSQAVPAETAQVNYGHVLNGALRLRKSWKESGPASMERSGELWERFNGTLNSMFSIIDQEHKRNFDRKEALVKEAEAVALSEEWDSASNRFQEIRAEWKSCRPAARRDEQMLWSRLQEAGDTFFGRRRAHFDSRKDIIREKLLEKERLIAELEIMVFIAGKSPLQKTAQNQSAAEILKKGIDLRNQFVVEGDSEKTYNNIKKRALDIIDIWEKGEQPSGREFYELERRFDELLDILKRR